MFFVSQPEEFFLFQFFGRFLVFGFFLDFLFL